MPEEGMNELSTIICSAHCIPKYQRQYAWKSKQAKDFWNDLIEYHRNKCDGSKYIFGQFIVYQSKYDNRIYVIDGQQRLTTLYIFLSSIREIISNICPDKNKMTDDMDNYMSSLKGMLVDFKTSGSPPFLTVSPDNKLVFDLIIKNNVSEIIVQNESQKNMVEVYNYFINSVSKYLLETDQDVVPCALKGRFDLFIKLRDVLDDLYKFKVFYIKTQDLRDAHRIFDVVNTRGLKLSNTDLVKNHIFATCYSSDEELRDDEHHLEEIWNNISSSLEKNFEQYFRYVLIAEWGLVSEDQIFDIVKNNLTTPDKVKKFVDDLKYCCGSYLNILKGNNFCEDDYVNRILIGIHDAKKSFNMFSPLLISVLLYNRDNVVSESERLDNIRKMVKALDVLVVRELFTRHSPTNAFESTFADTSSKLYNKKITIDQAVNSIYSLCCSDDTFASEIILQNDWPNTVARYILSELYNRSSGTSVVKKSVQLEHIMPTVKKFSEFKKYWPMTEDEKKENEAKIGNMVILESKVNQKIQHHSFSEKIVEYRHDNKLLDCCADYILGQGEWTIDSINERTQMLSEKMVLDWGVELMDTP